MERSDTTGEPATRQRPALQPWGMLPQPPRSVLGLEWDQSLRHVNGQRCNPGACCPSHPVLCSGLSGIKASDMSMASVATLGHAAPATPFCFVLRLEWDRVAVVEPGDTTGEPPTRQRPALQPWGILPQPPPHVKGQHRVAVVEPGDTTGEPPTRQRPALQPWGMLPQPPRFVLRLEWDRVAVVEPGDTTGEPPTRQRPALQPWGILPQPPAAVRNFRGGRGNPKLDCPPGPLPYSALLQIA